MRKQRPNRVEKELRRWIFPKKDTKILKKDSKTAKNGQDTPDFALKTEKEAKGNQKS
ncbi:MAG: hypothetical protein PHG65_03780 [Kiritimatiellae bacterium]|nr:hypothetical protein [Kiritimatiellia bacterium]